MTYFLNHYTLKYTPLSPLHIGTGDCYEPTNYVIDDGTLYEFDTGGAVAALSANDRAELSKIVSKPDAQMLKAVQKFFFDRREALKPWAINTIPVLDGVARLYESRVGQTVNREGNGGQVFNKLEIDRTAYNPFTRQPLLFGSSVKGAIRTALLNQLNNKAPLSERDKNLFQVENLTISEKRQKEREQKKIYPRLNQRLFEFSAGKFELDPMRLVQVGDAAWASQEDLPKTQIYLTVNRKKYKVVDVNGNERPSQANTKESLCKQLECVPAWRYRAFSAQFNLHQVNTLKGEAATSKLPKSELRFTMQEIAKRCSAFYLPILKAEMTLMRERGFLNSKWDESIQELLKAVADKLLKGQVFLLRVGRHSGAESITINGVRNIKIMKADPEYQDQTKTLWLAAQTKDQRTDLLPFGWVLVEVEPGSSPEIDWPELSQLCASQHNDARRWAEQHAQQKAKLHEKRQEAEQRREREDIERRLQIELATQAEQACLAKEQAEQQRLASLSPIDQEIEIFLKPIQAQEHDTRLLQELEKGRWEADDAKIVAQKVKALMEQNGKWMPDFAGDNKQKVKLKERSQKVLKYLQD